MKSICCLLLCMMIFFSIVGRPEGETLAGKIAQLSDLKNAIDLDESNADALRLLTVLNFNEEVGAEAKKIYDPLKDDDRSFNIDCELGQFPCSPSPACAPTMR